MTLLHTAEFSSWARGHLLCRVEDVAGRFALTFDDGPSPRSTPLVLDVLRRHDARATFFVLAGRVRRAPALLRRLVDEGHEAALHGELHWPLPLVPPWTLRSEIERCAAAVGEAAGVRARFYRPPFGFMMPSQAKFVSALGYESVLGDVYPEDPQRPGVDRIVARVLPRLRAGSILILHDGSPIGDPDRSQTLEALEIILARAAGAGLRPVSVRELLNAHESGGGARAVEPGTG
jgi:peptidoglycan/xylan/chitin deacetylase (PgdA/CDA1 family)